MNSLKILALGINVEISEVIISLRIGVNHMNKQSLLEDIEAHRRKMVSQASHSSLSNEKVIILSKKLDNLLNKYDRLMKNSSNSL